MNENQKYLLKIAMQLDIWVEEFLTGGWCTHQVGPMRKLSDEIYAYIGKSLRDEL